jgi:hypothetical protein
MLQKKIREIKKDKRKLTVFKLVNASFQGSVVAIGVRNSAVGCIAHGSASDDSKCSKIHRIN